MATGNAINNSLAITAITGLGTGVATALAINTGSAGAPIVVNGALGTPSSGTLTNCTFPTLNQNTTGTAAALTTARTIGGVSFDGTANIVPQTIQSVNEATDTTCFPLFISASGSQSLQPLNNANLTFNSNTGSLGATLMVATTSVTSASILASSNDSGALGASGTAFSDLFLASGAVINHNAGSSTITGGTNIWTFGGSGANGNGVVLPAGGTSLAPLQFTAGTLKTTPAAGDNEMDANCFYACTDAGNRGYLPVVNMIRQNANRANFANNTNQQAIFDSVANGTLTLETGTYEFEGLIQIQGTSATSGNVKFSLIGAGSATLANILYITGGMDAAVDTLTAWSGVSEIIATQTATNLATASIATVTTFFVKGTFQVTGAGTIIPSVAQTTAVNNSANTKAGSFMKFNRIGSTTVASVGQWS